MSASMDQDLQEAARPLTQSQLKRIESKKKKVQAFLRIAEENDMEGRGRKRKVTPSDPSVKEEEIAIKKQKTTNGTAEKGVTETINEEDLCELRKQLRARQKLNMQRPKLYLKPEFSEYNKPEETSFRTKSKSSEVEQPSGELETEPSEKKPLFLKDVQHVVMCTVQGNIASYKPRFCKFLRYGYVQHTLIISVEGLRADEYVEFRECFSFLDKTFEMQFEIISPCQYGLSIKKELFAVPLSRRVLMSQPKGPVGLIEEIKRAVVEQPEIAQEDMSKEEESEESDCDENFSRVDLVLNPHQMVFEGVPVPIHLKLYRNFVHSKREYAQVTTKSPMFAVDCEMVCTLDDPSALAWIAVVDERLNVVYESYVKPWGKITNYLTRYSGVTQNTLKGVTVRLRDIQKDLREILPPDAILCGQSLQSDLKAMKMFHPYIIDTSVIFNLSGLRERKTGLRRLAKEILNEDIQTSDMRGHSPVQDATTTMKLVQYKLKHGLNFGDLVLHHLSKPARRNKESEEENERGKPNLKNKTISQLQEENEEGKQKLKKKTLRNLIYFSNSNCDHFNFFTIAKEQQKSTLFVGPNESVESRKVDVDMPIATETDDDSVSAVCTNMSKHHLTFVELVKPQKIEDAEEAKKKKICRHLDRRIKTMVESTVDNSLVVVLFSGRGTKSNGMSFIHLTRHEDTL